MATLFEVLQFTDNLGNPLSNGHVFWYAAGTTTAKQTWQDTAETILNTLAYVTLDAYGRPPGGAFFIRGSYKLVVKDSTETTTYLTVDNINEYNSFDLTGLTASMADLNSTTTTAKLLGSTIPLVYTVLLADRGFTLMINALTANATINLPSAVTVGNTFKFWIKKTDKSSNKVSIIPFGTQTINGAAVAELFDYNDFVECRSDGSNWHLGGALIRGTIVNLVDDYDVLLSDTGKTYNCDATAASITIQLPSCSTVGKGFSLSAKKIDASLNTVILLASGSQTIDGVSSYVLSSQWAFVNIKTDGINWFIVNEVEPASAWTTGDRKSSYNRFQAGWVYLDDGTIGNASSNATSREDADTQNLWVFLYATIAEADLPMFTSGGSPVARSGVALNDYNNNYQLQLPYTQGRSEISVGKADKNTYVVGKKFGEDAHALSKNENATHHHPGSYVKEKTGAGGTFCLDMVEGTEGAGSSSQLVIIDDGQSLGHNTVHPVTPVYMLIKL
jgi:hypothetical protein